MASAASKIILSQSRDIPFNQLVLSQANVRRVKTGVSIEALAEDIARLTLLNYDDSTPEPWLDWSPWLKKLGFADVKPKAVLHFNHYDQLIAAAVAGQGVALGRSVLLAAHLADGRLLPMASPYRHISQRAYFLVAASGEPRPEVRLLSDWLQGQARASVA